MAQDSDNKKRKAHDETDDKSSSSSKKSKQYTLSERARKRKRVLEESTSESNRNNIRLQSRQKPSTTQQELGISQRFFDFNEPSSMNSTTASTSPEPPTDQSGLSDISNDSFTPVACTLTNSTSSNSNREADQRTDSWWTRRRGKVVNNSPAAYGTPVPVPVSRRSPSPLPRYATDMNGVSSFIPFTQPTPSTSHDRHAAVPSTSHAPLYGYSAVDRDGYGRFNAVGSSSSVWTPEHNEFFPGPSQPPRQRTEVINRNTDAYEFPLPGFFTTPPSHLSQYIPMSDMNVDSSSTSTITMPTPPTSNESSAATASTSNAPIYRYSDAHPPFSSMGSMGSPSPSMSSTMSSLTPSTPRYDSFSSGFSQPMQGDVVNSDPSPYGTLPDVFASTSPLHEYTATSNTNDFSFTPLTGAFTGSTPVPHVSPNAYHAEDGRRGSTRFSTASGSSNFLGAQSTFQPAVSWQDLQLTHLGNGVGSNMHSTASSGPMYNHAAGAQASGVSYDFYDEREGPEGPSTLLPPQAVDASIFTMAPPATLNGPYTPSVNMSGHGQSHTNSDPENRTIGQDPNPPGVWHDQTNRISAAHDSSFVIGRTRDTPRFRHPSHHDLPPLPGARGRPLFQLLPMQPNNNESNTTASSPYPGQTLGNQVQPEEALVNNEAAVTQTTAINGADSRTTAGARMNLPPAPAWNEGLINYYTVFCPSEFPRRVDGPQDPSQKQKRPE